jgi:hypothetical protein
MITPRVQVLHFGTCHPDDGDARHARLLEPGA